MIRCPWCGPNSRAVQAAVIVSHLHHDHSIHLRMKPGAKLDQKEVDALYEGVMNLREEMKRRRST